jgi:membrane protein YdbS with pleckstrin-like domain
MGYAIREKDITYQSGWLWKSMTTIPFNRVQHCDIRQGLIDRQFGLAPVDDLYCRWTKYRSLNPGIIT